MEHSSKVLSKQELYIRGHRRHHRRIGILRVLVFLGFWPCGKEVSGWEHWTPSFSVPPLWWFVPV